MGRKLAILLMIAVLLSGCGAVKNLEKPGSNPVPTPKDYSVDVKDTVQANPSEHYTVGDTLYFVADGCFSFLKKTLKAGLILTVCILGIGFGIGCINGCYASFNQ